MGTGIVGFQRFVPGLQTMKSHHRAFRPQPGRTARFFSGWKAQRAGLEKRWREMPAVYGLINNIDSMMPSQTAAEAADQQQQTNKNQKQKAEK